jgi:hypothetical protein
MAMEKNIVSPHNPEKKHGIGSFLIIVVIFIGIIILLKYGIDLFMK